MFLLKEGSRNSYNQDREEPRFSRNIRKLLNINLLHGDSFEDICRVIEPEELQKLKAHLVRILIAHKVLTPDPRTGKFIVAVDATGTHSYWYDYSGVCLSRTSKNGKVTYYQGVLEAKLVTEDGFCLSLASEWLENSADNKGESDKQDCETKAFKRLTVKMKELYPNLPVMVVADGLYASVPVIEIAAQSGWDYMLVLKDGCQKDLQEEIDLRPDRKNQAEKSRQASFLNDLELGGCPLNWLQWEETATRFCWLTNLKINDFADAFCLQKKGRMRWMIENEGFNTQKNLGYGLEHKFSRTSFTAIQNYYQCMQIAHMIEQLCLLGKGLKELIN